MHKRQEGTKMKTCYEFGNDPIIVLQTQYKNES
jgi:hypothetical protein